MARGRGHGAELRCAARPSLIVPHIGKLPSYLEYDFCAPAIRHVCEMLPLVVPAIDHPPHALLTKLETFLAALAFRIPEPLLAAGVKALCAVAAASLNHALVRELFPCTQRRRERGLGDRLNPRMFYAGASAASEIVFIPQLLCRR